ncbi:hypothetical protein HMF8227_01493 [Saliniradius amylolyticus]|uniref:TonB-dependent receptor n=1 Tax=Saliniradius amylolyticus TaxID=2183582 RepID=A0A2S2E2U6_9ALTE|nr:TonB-dependent receptor [Saliniradius amylolyticus]AWL11968.1 hypothetical protein HMF8227_01493 [Saliniradius amylolyticus]
MKQLNKITRSLKLALMVGSTLSAQQVLAQQEDNNAQNNSADDVEVIQVSGIRASQAKNLNQKRFSDSIVDAITAEDIGKFPDKNVAESLQRIPGVTIQRQFGEGAAVSIRGVGNELTKTTLNGQNVASTGWFVLEPAKRSFNYELLPSELVGDLEVYKSSQADIAEGGVGGTVIVNTRKPLDLDPNTVYASLEGSYQSDSEETDPQLSGLYSWKNDDGNFGVLVSAVAQKRNLARQGNEAFWQWGAGPVGFEQERERSAFTTAVQYLPTDNLELVVNYMDMQMEADNTNYALWLTQADTTWGDTSATEEFLGSGDNITPVKGPIANAYYQARPREATMNSEVFDVEANYTGDGYELHLQAGKTTSDGGTDFEMVVDDAFFPASVVNNGTYDFTNGNQQWMFDSIESANGAVSDISDYDPGLLAMGTGPNFNRTPKTDEETYFQGDIEFNVDYGPIYAIKTGAKFVDHESTSLRFEYTQTDGFDNTFATSEYGQGLVDVGVEDQSILGLNVDAVKDWAKASITGQVEDLGAHSEIQEDNFAAYVMAKYQGDMIRGNFGLRYVTTDATSTFYVDGQRTNEKADYSQVLPSFNMAMDLADDVILRFSASRAMARPQYIDMYTNPDVRGTNDDLPNNQMWIKGNVGLLPFISDQFDLGIEWYFNDSSLLSAGLFQKDVKNFVNFSEYSAPASEIPFDLTGDEAANGWTVQEKDNGKTAKVRGLELQYQQDFGNGFGSILNYTYTDTDTDNDTFVDGNGVLSDSSPHVVNASAYYENDSFQVRVSYNWRDEYMIRETGSYGNRLHDDFGVLDLSATYHVTDNVDVKLDVNNLTEEHAKQFGNNAVPTFYSGFQDGFPLYEYVLARRITAGVSVRF